MDVLNEALRAIEAQQKEVKEGTAAWMVGEQLKDICRAEPASAELILQDLSVKEMSITEAEKKIKAWADKHRVGNFACVTPMRAEEILREFYKVNWPEGTREGGLGHGMPKRGENTPAAAPVKTAKASRKVLDLSDFV